MNDPKFGELVTVTCQNRTVAKQETLMAKIRNWSRYQHYRDRNPPWIKLYFDLLSSRDWVDLDDASRVLAIACMLIASRNGGEIDDSEDGLKYLQRVAYLNTFPDLKPLIDCGFLCDASNMLATCYQDASTSVSVSVSVSPSEKEGMQGEKEVEPAPKKPSRAADHDAAVKTSQIPVGLESDEFRQAWLAYCDERRAAGKYMTPRAIEAALAKLNTVDRPAAIAALRDSVSNGWSGVFPRATRGSGNQPPPGVVLHRGAPLRFQEAELDDGWQP